MQINEYFFTCSSFKNYVKVLTQLKCCNIFLNSLGKFHRNFESSFQKHSLVRTIIASTVLLENWHFTYGTKINLYVYLFFVKSEGKAYLNPSNSLIVILKYN